MEGVKKITLANLGQATEQEVFDQVAKHLLKQMVRATGNKFACQYRGEGGLMCAAGCLMADDEYDAGRFEGRSWCGLVAHGWAPAAHSSLIGALQELHDDVEPLLWLVALERIAVRRGLKMPEHV